MPDLNEEPRDVDDNGGTATARANDDTMRDHGGSTSSKFELLQKVQAMMEVEAKLTSTMEKVEPWLPSAIYEGASDQPPNRPRVRPIPTEMDQVDQILAVARVLAARTSAPAGWNPLAPVIGFSTPAPLPHQLRGGALAALQLERARQAERDRKRQRLLEQQQQEEAENQVNEDEDEEDEDDEMDVEEGGSSSAATSGQRRDPKRREVKEHDNELARIDARKKQQQQQQQQQMQQQMQQQQQQQPRPQQDVSMNLSDSSSSDSDDSD